MPIQMPVSELRDAFMLALAVGGLIWAASAAYRGITSRLDNISEKFVDLAGEVRGELKAQDRRVSDLERRVRDLQVRFMHPVRRRDTATD